jgi:hypothetical protein
MRNPTATILTLIIVLGMNVSGVQLHPQEHSKETVQARSQSPDLFASCYQVAGVSRGLIGEDVGLFPTRFKLLNVPRAPGATYFNIRILDVKGERNLWEASWSWRPKGKDKLEINWGTGLGGFRGTLKRSASGELVGKMKEYCDSRCEYKRRTGTLHLRKISCGLD